MRRKIMICYLLICCLSLSCCAKKHEASIETDGISVSPAAAAGEENRLTLEELKSKYTGGENGTLVDATLHKNYVLIEYTKNNITYFNWYNLTTGDKDLLPVWDTHAKLKRVIDENNLVFISDGFHILSSHSGFPYLLLCERKSEQLGNDDDFFARRVDKYFRTDEPVEFGSGSKAVISDLRITLKGVELLFEPQDTADPAYKSWPMPLPQMRTFYVKEKNQPVIMFQDTLANVGSLKQKMKTASGNSFIKSVEIFSEERSSKILIHLKSPASFFHVEESRLSEGGMPIALFAFSSDISDQNY